MRLVTFCPIAPSLLFQSTHPLRGATIAALYSFSPESISIHAPLAGCDVRSARLFYPRVISIHAPLAGCDPAPLSRMSHGPRYFNPRTPCGVRPSPAWASCLRRQFQSTHPLRGATIWTLHNCTPAGISIHAPLAGCDSRACRSSTTAFYFNPRTPCGVRRDADGRAPDCRAISIHAPLAGCDQECIRPIRRAFHFNPRTPCGVRPTPRALCTGSIKFQSTHPLRGATPIVNN